MLMNSDDLKSYEERREAIFKKMKPYSIMIFPPNPTSTRSNDTENRYKPNSDLYYVSGYSEEESSVILFKNSSKSFQMSVLPRDSEKETWTGKRYGPKGAKKTFNADETYSSDKFEEKLGNLLEKSLTVYYRFGINEKFDKKLLDIYKKSTLKIPRNYFGPREIIDFKDIVHQMRLIKGENEINNLIQSCEIASEGHIEGMKRIKSDFYEYQIQGIIESKFLEKGGTHPAYPSICGTGANATILHYITNNSKLKDGDLFLVDAGTEYHQYCSDITRTYPVNGKFSDVQANVYKIVLESQNQAINLCKPGKTILDIHEKVLAVLTKGLIDLGVLEGDLESLIKEEKYKPYYMHKTSHWLGLDTHDAGYYTYLKDENDSESVSSVLLEPGMVLTVEPGLYFQPQIENLPEHLKGIGIRIEDDILITKNGHQNLTEKTPKTISEIEDLMNS